MLEWIVASSLLILLVLLLRRLPIAPWQRYALWLVVLVRLLVPVQLYESPVTVRSLLPEEHAFAQASEGQIQPPAPAAGGSAAAFNTVNGYGLYLTEGDYAAEFGVMSGYQIYDNLRLLVEANYIALWLNQSSSVWGGGTRADGSRLRSCSTEDAWNVNMSLIYKF